MTAVDDLNLTFSLRLNAMPTADARIALTYSQVAPVGNLVLRSSGLLCVRNGNAWATGSATTSCTSTPLAVGTTYRIRLHEIRSTGSDGVFEGYLATGTAPFGAPFARGATGTNTMRVDRVSVGTTTSVALDAVFDDVAIDGQPLAAPAAPSALAATSPSASEVDLSWADNATSESSYTVERSTSSSFASVTSFTAPANATSYVDRSTSGGTTYYYRVKATNASGDSGYSNVASVVTAAPPPAAPSGLVATVLSPSSTRLDWTDNASSEASVVVERSGDPSFASVTTVVLPANSVSYTDSGLPDGAFYYRVKAVNADGTASTPSNVARGPRIKNITFEDGAPTLVSTATGVSSNAGNRVVLETTSPIKGLYSARVPNVASAYLDQTFSGVDDLYAAFYVRLNALPSADYRIAQVLDAGTTVANVWVRATGALCLKWGNNWSGGSSAAGCTSTSLSTGSTYRVAVHQRRGDGTGNAFVEAFFAQGDNPFPQDANGNATPFTTQSVPPTDPGYWQSQATTFRFGGTLSTTPLDAVFDDVKLDSSFLPTVPLPPQPVAAPASLVATPLSPTSTRLTWTDNSSNETGFVVERSVDSSFASVATFTLPANTVSYTDSGLADSTYFYRVKATGPGGTSSSYTNVARGPRIKNVTFEDGTPGLVNAASGASSNPGGLVVQESASPLKGTYSARVPNVANGYLEQSFTGVDDLYVSFYVRFNALPTADNRIAQVLDGGTTVANLWLRPAGTLCLKWGNNWSGGSAGTACTSSTKPLAVGTVYRIGLHQRRGDGTSNALVEAYFAQSGGAFPQDAAGNAVPFTSQSITPATAGYWQSQATALRFGATLSTTALDAAFDDVKLDAAFLPPPS
jgi:hypothetical protein